MFFFTLVYQQSLGHHHTEETKAMLSASHRGDSPYKNLLDEMDKRQFTYTALAKLLNLSQPSLSLKMKDRCQFTDNDVAKLVEIFGKLAEYLFERDDSHSLVLASIAGENKSVLRQASFEFPINIPLYFVHNS